MTARAPKQWTLTKNETITSFENWRQNLVYILSLDSNFAPFLAEGCTWERKTSNNPTRGLHNDGEDTPEGTRRTAAQKNLHLDLMLGQIANYCAVISRNSITKNSISVQDIWQKIRQHYGFRSTGANFLNLVDIKLQADERPEDLFQRLMAFVEDNLLTAQGGIVHHGHPIDADEDLSPTLENMIVIIWLQLIHPGLPQLVKQRYGTELRNQSIASLKPEISLALSSLLEELQSIEDTKVLRSVSFAPGYRRTGSKSHVNKSCILCKTAGRPAHNSHALRDCRYLPESERRQLYGRSRLVQDGPDELPIFNDNFLDDNTDPDPLPDRSTINRVDVIQSPYLNTFSDHHPVRITLDTGATTNMVRASFAHAIQLPVTPASQKARQADGITPLDVIGEVHCQLTRDDHKFQLDALVVRQLDVDVLAGNPFLVANDIATRPAKRQIIIQGENIVQYGPQPGSRTTIRRTQAFVLRSPPVQVAVLPGDFIELSTPDSFDPDVVWALEPRLDCSSNLHCNPERAWPTAQEVSSVGHTIRLLNTTPEPIVLKKNEHICQVRSLSTVDVVKQEGSSTPLPSHQPSPSPTSDISIDPDGLLSPKTRASFNDLHDEFSDVFTPHISKYNGESGKLEAIVNVGPTLPPQRKGRQPNYNHETLVELQAKFDELEAEGVFATPEQMNVAVEYLNLSFLVRKPNGGSRLVTSFGEVAQYCKPQPALMPSIENVLRDIGKWRYIIKTDLLKSFYQIPLSHDSLKYCGVATPFKGIRVYTRCAMGMPGSESYLEELMSRVLGELIQDGCVAKLADDLFCGGNTPEEALSSWRRVLEALKRNNLRLSAQKTVVCPKKTNILGWIWSNGTLTASPHRIAALSTASPPKTVQGLRSFIGAYKSLSRVLRNYADLLHPLDMATAGKLSKDIIPWTEDLIATFQKAQVALSSAQTITIPRPSDHLQIVTDASVKERGLAATLYLCREDELLLAGFFSAKMKKHQITWLPCEVEALAIAVAVKHFAPYITASYEQAQILTDSRPCVQAYNKLQRGEFSASSRVSTFLSTVSRYNLTMSHISGAANVPADYCSRHPSQCTDQSCQICKFVNETDESVIRHLSVNDVVVGAAKMPFSSRAAWRATQQDCPDLRRTHSQLSQGTRPSKKDTRIQDVKRYLRFTSIASDGLLIVREDKPFHPTRERIVVPRSVLDGLLTAIHIRFHHPSVFQTKQLFIRGFFALDIDKAIQMVNDSCHHCVSLKSIPAQFYPQSSCSPPTAIGTSFAADVMKRYRQLVFVVRETVTSFTRACFIESERHNDLRDAIITLFADMRNLGDAGTIIRVDSAPGFVALAHDPLLQQYGIALELGSPKNVNKNPVAERAIDELGLECLHLSPEGSPLTKVSLALAVANMNSRIRKGGLSARELFTQRDQLTGEQLPIGDREIILQQHKARLQNHPLSSLSKAHGRYHVGSAEFQVGDLVHLKREKDKTRVRDKYMVTSVSEAGCQIRKFTKSQFRSKTYQVRHSDCFHVKPTCLPISRPIRGLQKSDAVEDSSIVHMPIEDPLGIIEDIIPSSNCDPSLDHDLPHSNDDHIQLELNPQLPHSECSRRSTRRKTVPLWQKSGEWLMD